MKLRKVLLTVCVCLAWLVIVVFMFRFASKKLGPYEAEEKIWLPDKYTFVNLDDNGDFMHFERVKVSGTATWVNIEDYKKAFGQAETDIHIMPSGYVYYICKKDGRTYYTTMSYFTYIGDEIEVINIIGDVGNKKLLASYYHSSVLYGFPLFISIVLIFVFALILEKLLKLM